MKMQIAMMDTVGAKTIVIEHLINGAWREYCRFKAKYNYGNYYYGGNFEFVSVPGINYRATLTAYAKDYSGGSDTGSVASGSLGATT